MRTLHLCEDVQNNRKKCFQLVPNDVNDVPTNLVAVLELESAESLQDHHHHTQPIESLYSRIRSTSDW